MYKKVTQRVGWVENPTSPQAVLNLGFINPTYSVIVRGFVSLFLAFHYICTVAGFALLAYFSEWV